MQPIHINEIPIEIKEFLNKIISINFPRQGYTSDLGIIESDQGIFALKRTKEKLFNSVKKRSIYFKQLEQSFQGKDLNSYLTIGFVPLLIKDYNFHIQVIVLKG
ncbi:hypothetical protein [Oceanobacillus kapialis]|uniref:Aminoglycoside phosphotransferase domain-containing protein n=1 Tax=Oceanobacillus kapialis TaxID=481353 RepID=A0ABW5Q386_9BACI